jgi:integrase
VLIRIAQQYCGFNVVYFWVTEFLEGSTQLTPIDPQNVELNKLQGQLSGVLAQARASSTNQAYMRSFQKWKEWTLSHSKVRILPANPQFVALYLIDLANSAASFSVVKAAVCGIAWAHKLSGLDSPSDNELVAETLAGLKVRLAKPRLRKEPFSVALLNQLFVNMAVTDLTDVRNVALMGLAFYAFLRFDDVARLKVNNIAMHRTHVEINIEKAKNDQLRQGNVVVIAKLAQHCPVAVLQLYMQLANSRAAADNFLFRRIICVGSSKKLHDSRHPLKYSNVRDIVKAKAITLGLDPTCYGTHSLRAGGCSSAANSGISDRLFQRHGRWASVAAKDGYVKDSLKSRLSVTQCMT